MTAFRTATRFAAAFLLATASFALPACKGSNNPTASAPVTTFVPDPATPGPAVALASGTSSGASINVIVTVTDVNQLLGAAFRIKYLTTAIQFNGMTDTDSFLRKLPGGHLVPSTDILFLEDHTTTPGEIVITATRLPDPNLPADQGGPVGPVDVTGTSDLVVLNFTARQAIVAASTDGRLDFGDPKQLCDGTVVPPGCGTITVSWFGGGISAQ